MKLIWFIIPIIADTRAIISGAKDEHYAKINSDPELKKLHQLSHGRGAKFDIYTNMNFTNMPDINKTTQMKKHFKI